MPLRHARAVDPRPKGARWPGARLALAYLQYKHRPCKARARPERILNAFYAAHWAAGAVPGLLVARGTPWHGAIAEGALRCWPTRDQVGKQGGTPRVGRMCAGRPLARQARGGSVSSTSAC